MTVQPPNAVSGIVFDTAAVVGWAKNQPYPQGIYWSYVQHGGLVAIPAAVLTAASAVVAASDVADATRDLLDALLNSPHTVVAPLDRATAGKLGALLGTRAHRQPADALVSASQAVSIATGRGWYVLTDRVDVLTDIDPEVLFDSLP